jgi:Cellulose-binding Sde182, nucleoside hydrolase-like domain/Cellulose-binding protein Sde0182, C-terminal domain
LSEGLASTPHHHHQHDARGKGRVRARFDVATTIVKRLVTTATVLAALACMGSPSARAQEAPVNALAARIDPYVEQHRVVVMTDIANEPDDQMSMVRFLVYSNHFDVEGLIATTSTWMRNKVRPDVVHMLVEAYEQVRPRLMQHQPGFPAGDALKAIIVSGQTGYGMDSVGSEKMTPGAELIIRSAERTDPRPLWVLAWGGTNTLAQALLHARTTKTSAELDRLVSKLRVYAISDQDDAGPWIRREFPTLHYIGLPSTPDGDQYYLATWTGISGDRFYKNAPGADFGTFSDAWLNTHVRGKGPLGKHYPLPCCIHEGDTPAFLGLINNGLASFMSPTYGGWGGRYVWRTYYGETRPFWTQGGDSFPGRDNSRDSVTSVDGRSYTSDQATIWRWRPAFQHDFAARMDWTIKDVRDANHNPEVVVNGAAGKAPVLIDATVDAPLTLDAEGTRDPDGDSLRYTWFYYAEAGTGIPGQPVAVGRRGPGAGGGVPGEGGIPGPAGGPREPPPRVTLADEATSRVTVTPRVPGTAHIILAVEDSGSPTLTSYRRVILTIRAK